MLPSSLVRKRQKNTPPADKDELARILQERQKRAETTARVKREEEEKDEHMIVKQVFTEADKRLGEELDKVLDENESSMIEMLKIDLPPPAGHFKFNFRYPTLTDSLLESIPEKQLYNGDFRLKLTTCESVSSGQLNFLLETTILPKNNDEKLSSVAFDSAIYCLTGDPQLLQSSRVAYMPNKKHSPRLIQKDWKLNADLCTVFMGRFLNDAASPESFALRFLRLLEIIIHFKLIEHAVRLFLLLIKFVCFPKCTSELQLEVRRCLTRLVESYLVDTTSFEKQTELADQIAQICMGRFPEGPESVSGNDNENERDIRIHRAVTISLVLTGPTLESICSGFQTRFIALLLPGFANLPMDKDYYEKRLDILQEEYEATDDRIRILFAYLIADIDEVQLMKRNKIFPKHFNRWHSTMRLVDMILSEAEIDRASKSFAFKQIVGLINHIDKNFLTAYTVLMDFLRLVKKTCEAFRIDNFGLVQSDVRQFFKSSSKPAKEDL